MAPQVQPNVFFRFFNPKTKYEGISSPTLLQYNVSPVIFMVISDFGAVIILEVIAGAVMNTT